MFLTPLEPLTSAPRHLLSIAPPCLAVRRPFSSVRSDHWAVPWTPFSLRISTALPFLLPARPPPSLVSPARVQTQTTRHTISTPTSPRRLTPPSLHLLTLPRLHSPHSAPALGRASPNRV